MAIYYFAIIPMATGDFVAAADLTQRHPLKAYDALQLAVALHYGQILSGHPFTFVSGDSTLLAAAQAEGLVTENPFDHAIPDESPGRSG
jgi:predicted nucleic acid-binding protein